MSTILALDTCSQSMSIALMEESNLLAEITLRVGKNHSLYIVETLAKMMTDLSIGLEQIKALGVTKGPGSYTGTRIAVTVAKTIAFACKVPLYSSSSLRLLAMNGYYFPGLVLSCFDARGERLYAALYQQNLTKEVLSEKVYPIAELIAYIAPLRESILVLGELPDKLITLFKKELGSKILFGAGADNKTHASRLAQLTAEQIMQAVVPELLDFAPIYM